MNENDRIGTANDEVDHDRPAGEIELTRRNLIGLRVSLLAGMIMTGASVVGALSGPTVSSVQFGS